MNILGVLASIFITIAYIVSIRGVLKSKQATKEQMKFWFYITTALVFATANSIQVLVNTGVWGFFVIEIVNLTLAVVSWVLAYKYYRRNKEATKWYEEQYSKMKGN